MKNFDQVLLRLKQAVQQTSDQEVARLLGLSKAAFAERKKRDAFPEDKLLALSVRQPELNLDVTYVLTGERRSDWERATLSRTAEAVAKLEPEGGPITAKLQKAYKSTPTKERDKAKREARNQELLAALKNCTDEDVDIVMQLAVRLARAQDR